MSVSDSPEGFAVIPNWMARDGSISPAAKAVYINLSSRTGREGTCWPSQRTIASETGYTDRHVKRAVAELVALGVVRVTSSRSTGPVRNTYHLRLGGKAPKGTQASPG